MDTNQRAELGVCVQDQLLFCDDCDRGYHMYCLSPPMTEPPEGELTPTHHPSAPFLGLSLLSRALCCRNTGSVFVSHVVVAPCDQAPHHSPHFLRCVGLVGHLLCGLFPPFFYIKKPPENNTTTNEWRVYKAERCLCLDVFNCKCIFIEKKSTYIYKTVVGCFSRPSPAYQECTRVGIIFLPVPMIL